MLAFRSRLLCSFMFAGLMLCASSARAQEQISDASLLKEIATLSRGAQTVFVGQIVSTEHKAGYVEVVFRVERPVRGNAGPAFCMREWSGLWAPGSSRYTPGARVLAFVRGAGEAGFQSPVRGAEGLVPVVVQGANAPALVDLRRVAASVLRAPSTPLLTEENGAFLLPDLLGYLVGQRPGESIQRVALPGSSGHVEARLPGALPVYHGPRMPQVNAASALQPASASGVMHGAR